MAGREKSRSKERKQENARHHEGQCAQRAVSERAGSGGRGRGERVGGHVQIRNRS